MEELASEAPLFSNRRVTVTPTTLVVGKRRYLLSDFSSASVGDHWAKWLIAVPFFLMTVILLLGGRSVLAAAMLGTGISLLFNAPVKLKCLLLHRSMLLSDGKSVRVYTNISVKVLEKIAGAVNLAINSQPVTPPERLTVPHS